MSLIAVPFVAGCALMILLAIGSCISDWRHNREVNKPWTKPGQWR